MTYLILSTFLIFADYGQTRYIASDDEYYERNIVLGRDPSIRSVNAYFVSALALNASAGIVLKPKNAVRLWKFVSTMQAAMIINNKTIGIGFNYDL